MRSTPSAASASTTAIDSSSVKPPRWKSAELSLIPTGKAAPTRARIARYTSTAKRRRFSGLPPHPSVRTLWCADKNWLTRYPCAPWTCTPPNPASFATPAA